ncbi:nicotinate-nucleotide--dimethylbenzimidazole phosphoribosyltransferase [Amaricoccus sp.]|uniref:nicotinate-nucleotide--dimethylbenzimidazole phosphoribosyltransferase n=1 Tax=Amaricoccus sp. TaxID=1872485 RepID=UPI001B53AAB4|nr:nicotinate-nucleotide--dimethylbenzimidazole phosphoribosyltransferase [Amaricoccus sp.]MBP7241115.1 nicotinate-nucleotide--dimethylbenzimidazole phosphoribosyltransferase [Amaricoccus sp.]
MSETRDFEARLRAAIDGKTKPLGALGRVEALAAQIARTQGTLEPRLDACALTIFAADHGVATEGVSAYPQDVTRQMLANFLAGGAAATVFAAGLGVPVTVVDAGVAGPPLDAPGLVSRRIAPGTASFLHGPAMSRAELARALDAGRALGAGPVTTAAAFGEMGIGNTAAAAAVAHKLTGLPLDTLVGRGAGLDDAGLARKRAIVGRACARTADRLDPEAALAEYGGFEIAMMTGAMLGAVAAGRVVLVDGFIATAAAACAGAMAPEARGALVYAHRSAENGHGALLDHLGARPLLDLGMRLGEGSGALLAWPIVRAAADMLRDMASFESAGVSRA